MEFDEAIDFLTIEPDSSNPILKPFSIIIDQEKAKTASISAISYTVKFREGYPGVLRG